MRNPNGYGSVIKLGGNRRRPYAVRVTAGWTSDGKAIYKYLGYFEKRVDAIKALAEYNINPYDLNGATLTFKQVYELVAKKEFENCSKQKKGCWVAAFKKCESIHDRKIQDLKTVELQAVIDDCDTRSKSTLTNILTVFHAVFKYALQNDYIQKDYSKFVEINKTTERKIKNIFTDDEIKKLWETKDNFYSKITLILIYTGFRVNELLTMQMEHVHLQEGYFQYGLKTKSGKNRIVPIHNRILPLIVKLYDMNFTRAATSLPNWQHSYFITGDNGCQVPYNSFSQGLQRHFNDIGISCHTAHECRHTTASLLAKYGANDLYVKRILGHISNDITKDVYTHVDIKELTETINLIP